MNGIIQGLYCNNLLLAAVHYTMHFVASVDRVAPAVAETPFLIGRAAKVCCADFQNLQFGNWSVVVKE